MPLDLIVSLLALLAVANVVLMVVAVLPRLLAPGRGAVDGTTDRSAVRLAAADTPPANVLANGLPGLAFDRLVRVAGWASIVVALIVVVAGGFWVERQAAIVVLLALAGLALLVAHDLLPTRTLGSLTYVVEGSVAITFGALLVLFTGQAASPFFFVFLIIVVGAALVAPPPATAVFTVLAGAAYLVAGLVPTGNPAPGTLGLATVATNLTALALVAYVATVVAVEHRRSRDEAIRLSTVDPLTGLFNRTFFFAAVEREIARSDRSGRGFCLLMIDLDDLKVVNDRFGHFVGDRLLEGVGRVIGTRVRRIDTAARYGGDEFVVLLPETDLSGGLILAEKIRQGATGVQVQTGDGEAVRASLSIGVAAYPADGTTADELLIAADQAMFASKRAGRDRVTGRQGPVEADEGTSGDDWSRRSAVVEWPSLPIEGARWERIEIGRGGRGSVSLGRVAYRR